MKIEILTDNLKKALNSCERITRKVLSLPVLQNVLLVAKGSSLELTTTNLETTIKWWILAKVEKPGQVIVPATFLTNLINLISAEKIEISSENESLILTTHDQKTKIQGQNPEDFPIIPKIEKENSLRVSAELLCNGLQQVVDLPSSSQIRPEISGVYFHLLKNKLKIAATDSFRLAEKTLDIEVGQKDGGFILPQGACREVINAFGSIKEKISIYSNPNQILFEYISTGSSSPQVYLMSRLVEGDYPRYQEIIPKKFTTKLQIDKALLENQIKKAGLFSGKIAEVKLGFRAKENKMMVLSQSPETGQHEAFLPCKIDGDSLEVSFNYRFLLDGLNNLHSSEVILELAGEDSPGALRPVGDASYFYILMPIKAN